MKSNNCASGIGGVEVGVLRYKVKDVIALTRNGNIKEGMQTNVEVGETFVIVDVCRIKIELQRTIDMIED